MKVLRFPSAVIVAAEAVDAFIRLANECINARNVFRVALAGGSTPKRMYEMLREATVPWNKVEFYFSDERFVLPTDEQSNERAARLALLDHISAKAIYGMVTTDTPETSAAAYAAILPAAADMDLVMLGLGTDGHTASLFPGEPCVFEESLSVVASRAPVNAPDRITLTPMYMNAAAHVWFLVTGADKAEALGRVLAGEEDWSVTPAQAVARHGRDVTIFTDQ